MARKEALRYKAASKHKGCTVAKKALKPTTIPLESLFIDGDFQRHYESLMNENASTTDIKLRNTITAALTSNARDRVKYLGRQKKCAERLRESARKYTELNHKDWKIRAAELKVGNPALSVSAIANRISKTLDIPQPTIKAYLLKYCRELLAI
jgi:hypothetical protein